jgi:hypothetical protein
MLRLDARADVRVRALSGGERRRLDLACTRRSPSRADAHARTRPSTCRSRWRSLVTTPTAVCSGAWKLAYQQSNRSPAHTGLIAKHRSAVRNDSHVVRRHVHSPTSHSPVANAGRIASRAAGSSSRRDWIHNAGPAPTVPGRSDQLGPAICDDALRPHRVRTTKDHIADHDLRPWPKPPHASTPCCDCPTGMDAR